MLCCSVVLLGLRVSMLCCVVLCWSKSVLSQHWLYYLDMEDPGRTGMVVVVLLVFVVIIVGQLHLHGLVGRAGDRVGGFGREI